MKNKLEKPTPEAKALSLFLMAFKKESTAHKEKSKRMNKLWGQVTREEVSMRDYLKEVEKTLASFGGYTEVIWKTVKYYIKKTGEWTLEGDDKYCVDAREIATKILKK